MEIPAQSGAASHQHGLRIAIIAAAAVELLSGLTGWLSLFGVLRSMDLASLLIGARLLLQPILAMTALVLAARCRVRGALGAMAANIFMGWLSVVPVIPALLGLGPYFPGAGGWIAAAHFVFLFAIAPVLALVVVILAARNKYLRLATVLAVLPTVQLFLWTASLAFG